MAKKSSNKTETPKSASRKAKNAPLSNSAIRFAGFLIAFIGLMLIITKNSIISTALTVASIFAILWGLFLVSGSFKKLIGKADDKNKHYLNLFIGLVLIVAGILLLLFGGQIEPWFIIIIGALIGIYGLLMMIKFVCATSSKRNTLGIVLSILTLITGILICLLYIGEISSASSGVCYIIFGAIATAVGCAEIICY